MEKESFTKWRLFMVRYLSNRLVCDCHKSFV